MQTTEIYKGITIEIENEEGSENPFENWDGLFPTMVNNLNYFENDYSKGDIDSYLCRFLSYNRVKRNQSKLLNLMGVDIADFKEEYPTDEYNRTHIVDEYLEEWLKESFDNREIFCNEFKIPCLNTTSRGYSQGDYAELFICYTPEFEKLTGCTDFSEKSMQSTADTWGYWAWGDVYWFNIEHEELNDSCGGFYGDDHEKSGLMEMAREAIDYHFKKLKENNENKLKVYIKNNVPLEKRELIKIAS